MLELKVVVGSTRAPLGGRAENAILCMESEAFL